MIEMILPLWAATAFPNALKIYCHPKKTDSAGQNEEEYRPKSGIGRYRIFGRIMPLKMDQNCPNFKTFE